MTLNEYINNFHHNDVSLELVKRLETFSDDKEFIYGILISAKTDEERKKVIQYIDLGEDVSYESIILYALEISLARKG